MLATGKDVHLNVLAQDRLISNNKIILTLTDFSVRSQSLLKMKQFYLRFSLTYLGNKFHDYGLCIPESKS